MTDTKNLPKLEIGQSAQNGNKVSEIITKYQSPLNKWEQLLFEETENISIPNINISILNQINKYIKDKGGILLLVDVPLFPSIKLTDSEKQINSIDWSNRIQILKNCPTHLTGGYFNELDINYTMQVFDGPFNVLRKNYMINANFTNDLVNVDDGYRKGITKEILNYEYSIYLFGSSRAYCFGCEEAETISSFIEKQMDNHKVRVLNRGVRAANFQNALFAIYDTNFNKNDIVIIYDLGGLDFKDKKTAKHKFNYLDLSKIFQRPHKYGNVFFDHGHLTPKGNKIVAQFLHNKITDIIHNKIEVKNNSCSQNDRYIFDKINNARKKAAIRYIDNNFSYYLNSLESLKREGINGAIVMNCNPFTLGHQYLISYASHKVDNLYIFVVEEDRSYFPFLHRFKMVKNGVNHLHNVTIIPSSKYIVSSITFPDYFCKEGQQKQKVNVKYDLEIFAYFIAPTLSIKKRFIGKEPFCDTTRAYNEAMKETLSKENIDVIEIDRKENDSGAISATKVRHYIKENNTERLDKFLPKTTISFLKQHNYIN